VQISRLGN
ncbi:hypothetical protein KL937_005291, partial [Ogataea polymorpha]